MGKFSKIALLHPSLACSGGAEKVVVWLAEELVRRGRQVTVFTQDYDGRLHGDLAGQKFPVVFFPFGRTPEEVDLKHRQEMAGQLAEILAQYDLINPHNFPCCLWAVWAKEVKPDLAPLVWFCEEPFRALYENQMHERYKGGEKKNGAAPPASGLLRIRRIIGAAKRSWLGRLRKSEALGAGKELFGPEMIRRLDREAVSRLDLILANSSFTARQVEKIFPVKAVGCLLGSPPLEPKYSREVENLGRYFLTATRFYPIKNLGRAVEAVGRLKKSGRLRGFKYVIVGEGDQDYLREIAAQIKNLGLTEQVSLKNFLPEDKLAALLAGAEFILCPSLEEPFGLVPLEAASLGRPAIASDYGGYAETIIHEQTGLLVDPLDPGALAAAIESLMADPEAAKRMGQAAQRHYRENLTFSRFVDRWEQLIEQYLNR